MPAVHREPRPGLLSGELDDSDIWSGIQRTEAPRPVEIVFPSRPVDSGSILAVNENHVVAFVPGAPLVVQHRHDHPYELPVSLSIENDVIVGTQFVEPLWVFACLVKIIAVKIALVPSLARSTLPILSVKVR